MKLRYQKFICVIMAICMMFSGMCLNNTKADSLFERVAESTTTSYIDSLKQEGLNNESCTIEMLGVRNTVNILGTIKRSVEKWEGRTSLVLLCMEEMTSQLSNYHIATITMQFLEGHGRTVVLEYIHNQDGKK